MKKLFGALLATLLLFTTASAAELDIKKYLSQSGDTVYPTATQFEMLESLIPEECYSPFPTIEDRAFWGAIAKSDDGKSYLAEALSLLGREPEVPISDEIYRRANLEGNRTIYKPRYYNTMDRLERFLLAECMENEGRFLPQIETYCKAILSMKSWLHPNHDDANNTVLDGLRMTIDLGARKFGFVLSLTDITLTNDRLSEELRDEIKSEVRRRITDSYLRSCRGEDDPSCNRWVFATSNWNSVCTSGSLLSIMTTSQSHTERVAAIGCAINSMAYYLSGFGEDGYCSEGLGYWNYGFGHYLYLAEIIHDYTDGAVDLFKFDNPEKLTAVANFPARYEIHKRYYAPFSDGVTSVADGTDNIAYLLSAKHYGSRKPTYFVADESVFSVIGWRDADQYTASGEREPLPLSTIFDDCGIVISRGAQPDRTLSIAMKSGHNGENHNHNDVGSYFILLDEDIVAGDIGAPSYVAGAFSENNPARSSWGHPVPRINNTLQSKGIEFKGSVTKSKFKTSADVVEMDLLPAYEIPELTSLDRTFQHIRKGSGEIIVSDSFTASAPVTFGTAVMVNVDYTISGNKITLSTGSYEVDVIVEAKGGEIVIKDEVVPVEKLRSGRKSYRIGIDFVDPLAKGTITVRYQPR